MTPSCLFGLAAFRLISFTFFSLPCQAVSESVQTDGTGAVHKVPAENPDPFLPDWRRRSSSGPREREVDVFLMPDLASQEVPALNLKNLNFAT